MTSIQYLKGVGPKRAILLNKLEIYSPFDLLEHFPVRWQDRRLSQIKENIPYIEKPFVFRGKVVSVRDMYTAGTLRIFKAIISSEDKEIEAFWFKRHTPKYDVFAKLRKDIRPGETIWITGKPEDPIFSTKIRVDEYCLDTDEKEKKLSMATLVPLYSLTEGLNQKLMRKIMHAAISAYASKTTDLLPPEITAKRAFMPYELAVRYLHFPQNPLNLKEARKRFIYEEFFLMTLAWAIKRRQTKTINKGHKYKIRKHLLSQFKKKLGFEFTKSQKIAINKIFSDMMSRSPMTRLLEGDVGSGKTVVAMSALLLAAENKYQGVFIAPTEILAEQHFMTFEKFLGDLPLKFELLTARITGKRKKEIIEKVRKGEIDVLIGTHSLLEESVKFKNLKMIVIDEQHRFGVRQRAALRRKGENADILIMTATPIPRTLFLALYGDLDLSVLRDMPPGRKQVCTFSVDEKTAFEETKKELFKGRQAYIVYPVIEESDDGELRSVKSEFEKVTRLFPDFKTGMLHGQMKPSIKKGIMEDFLKGKIRILVSTPVVEVGIDVPNASVMVINNAERFGLASLHQLRGRIGRGEHESKCFLVCGQMSPQARERTNIMCTLSNGFEISEKDVYMRGAGEVMGLRQHGEMRFKIADIYSDSSLLKLAMEDKDEIIKKDPNLQRREHAPLKNKLFKLYQEKWNIIDLS